jgi:hypothetical protein
MLSAEVIGAISKVLQSCVWLTLVVNIQEGMIESFAHGICSNSAMENIEANISMLMHESSLLTRLTSLAKSFK